MKSIYSFPGLCVLLASCAHHPQPASPHTAPDVTIAQARVERFEQTAPAIGRVGGVNGSQTKLSFVVPGVINTISVQIGDRVYAGQPLATLDSRGYQLSEAQSRADVSVAAANARQAAVDRFSTRIGVDEASLRREQSLYAAGVAPRKDIDAAQAQLAQDRADASAAHEQVDSNDAQMQSAQVRQAIAERDLQNTTLRAPSDSVVTAIYHRQGENVDQTMPVIALSPVSVDEITLSVSNNDIGGVHTGDTVRFNIIGTALHSTGLITGVSSAIDPTTQTATVIANGLPKGAPVGSLVQATIVIANRRGVVVPQTAVVDDPQSGNAVAFVAVDDKDGSVKFQQRIVHVALRNDTMVLIASGLRPGERVASRGGFALLAPADTGGD